MKLCIVYALNFLIRIMVRNCRQRNAIIIKSVELGVKINIAFYYFLADLNLFSPLNGKDTLIGG